MSAVEVDLGVPIACTDDEEDALVAPSAWDEDIAGIVAGARNRDADARGAGWIGQMRSRWRVRGGSEW